jgi:hypothetical protein
MKKTFASMAISALLIAIFSFYGCQKDLTQSSVAASAKNSAQSVSNSQGVSTEMPAYYDSTIFNIFFAQFSPNAAKNLIAHNSGLNFIYQSDNGLPNNQPFISVIDAIPGDGMNPVWREVQIVFNQGFTPHQLYSDNEVLADASGPNPEITLDSTDEVYWCPVVGGKQH